MMMMNSAFAPLWGLQRQCFSFRNYPLPRLQQDANPAGYFKAHLLLGLSLPFLAIPPAAAAVVPRLRESTWTTRNIGLFSFGNFNLNVCAAHRLESSGAMRKLLPNHVYNVKIREKTASEILAGNSHTPGI